MIQHLSILAVLGFCALTAAASNSMTAMSGTRSAKPAMEKYASKEAIFLVYKPKGWTVSEGAQPGFRTLSVADPQGRYETAMFYGKNPAGNVRSLTKAFATSIGRQFPDFRIANAMVSRDGKKVMFDATFTVRGKGKRDFRCWVTGDGGDFTYSSVETPAGELSQKMPLLLTILSNVRVFNGAFDTGGVQPIQVRMVQHRLADGSASFVMPANWECKDIGKTCFVAGDSNEGYAFFVTAADVITPNLGVRVPGVPVHPYMSPSRAMKTLLDEQGLARNMQFEKVIPRNDLASQMAQVFTSGPVTVEEFIYTCDTRSGRCKAYTFGFTFGSRLNTSWSLRHLTVMAPVGKFDAFVGNFATMLESYRIDDAWVQNYIAQGLARLREMQRKTAEMVARNARDIPAMMQAAYDERQRSMDYIDYQRTSYIRGTQDWISSVEGGTVYHSDSWGTKNTTTGEYWEGTPYDYVHFNGENPKYNEDMTAINSRELWERYVR